MERNDTTKMSLEYRIPDFVKELLANSRFERNRCVNDPRYAPAYTFSIETPGFYETKAQAVLGKIKFKRDLRRLCRWADKHAAFGTAQVIGEPVLTPGNNYIATVSIYDPVMAHIEKYIKPAPSYEKCEKAAKAEASAEAEDGSAGAEK